MKRFLCFLFILIVSFSILSACSNGGSTEQDKSVVENGSAQTQSKRTINGTISSFSVETLNGSKFTPEMFSDYDITIINFWGTYCPPCIAEMPDLAEYKENIPENINLITYCIDGSQNPNEAQSIIDDADLDAVVITNADGDFETILSQIQYVPTTLFIDSSGNIVGNEIIGGVSSVKDVYNEHIKAALEEIGMKQ